MELIMLGTGSASSIQFYNECFALKKNQEYMLIDGGREYSLYPKYRKITKVVEK